jgi:hypothetical protein
MCIICAHNVHLICVSYVDILCVYSMCIICGYNMYICIHVTRLNGSVERLKAAGHELLEWHHVGAARCRVQALHLHVTQLQGPPLGARQDEGLARDVRAPQVVARVRLRIPEPVSNYSQRVWIYSQRVWIYSQRVRIDSKNTVRGREDEGPPSRHAG